MVRNDYRRSLIMLRTYERGYSGHVRLEHRTMTGSMYFMIRVPAGGEVLCAVLVRRDAQGVYFAEKLGELRRDGRGQASLAYSFDPRNIGGRPLDDYLVVSVVVQRPDRCDLVLSGNVNGSQEVNLSAVATASCYACQGNRPGEPGGPSVPERPVPGRPLPERPVPDRPEPERPSVPERPNLIQPRSAAEDGENAFPETRYEEPADDAPAADLPFGSEASEAQEYWERSTAAEAAGLDPLLTWPGTSEAVRNLFASQPPLENVPEDGYTYVSAPMPVGSGYESVLVGILSGNGQPMRMAYALPSVFSAEPPAGMENFIWYGTGSDGWWVAYTDAVTGEPVS